MILVLKAPSQPDKPALLRRELLLQRIYKEIEGEMLCRVLQVRHIAIERINRLLTELENEPRVLADHLHEENILLLAPEVEQKGKKSARLLPEKVPSPELPTSQTPILTMNR